MRAFGVEFSASWKTWFEQYYNTTTVKVGYTLIENKMYIIYLIYILSFRKIVIKNPTEKTMEKHADNNARAAVFSDRRRSNVWKKKTATCRCCIYCCDYCCDYCHRAVAPPDNDTRRKRRRRRRRPVCAEKKRFFILLRQ